MDSTPVLKQLTSCDIWIWDHHKYSQSKVQYISDSNMFSADNYIIQIIDVEYKIVDHTLFIDMEQYKAYCPANALFVIRFNYGKHHEPIVFWMPMASEKLRYEIVDKMLVTDTDFHENVMKNTKNHIGAATNFAIFITCKKIHLDKDRRTEGEMLCYTVKNAMIRFNKIN